MVIFNVIKETMTFFKMHVHILLITYPSEKSSEKVTG